MKFIITFDNCPIFGQRYVSIKSLPTRAEKSKKRKKNKFPWN